jgi:dolichol-phosphate mannosyltransferase
MNKQLITIVIPVHNEEKNIPLVHTAILEAIKEELNYDFDIIFIDDGSTDNSAGILDNISKNFNNVKIIIFSRNFGHQSAIEAGLVYSKGDVVIMMDGDLQHPPRLIPELLRKWEHGYKIVNTKRAAEGDNSFLKNFTSKAFYYLLNKVTDTFIEPGSADFRLLDRQVVNELNKIPEKNKFYRGLVSWVGYNSTIIEYAAAKRIHGSSSFTYAKMFSLARVGITSFSLLPMKIISILGLALVSLGSLVFIWMLYYKYFVNFGMFSGSAILAVFIIINNGFLILIMGINSIYQMSMFRELQGRPNYIIRETMNI